MRNRVPRVATFLLPAIVLAAPEEVLDARRTDVLEDEDAGRSIAEACATLVRDGSEVRLRIVVSAVGPFVEPPIGFEGIRGANPIAAREMEAILRERAIRASTRVGGAGRNVPFSFGEGRRARLPERRRMPDRSVSPPRPGKEAHLVELVAESAPLGEGLHETEFLVRGAPRLRIRYVVREGAGRILELRGGHPRVSP